MPAARKPPSRVFAIVPAAGRSRRMGRAKQLLDLGGRPMLLATVEPLAAAQIAGVMVVTHRLIARQISAALPAGVLLGRNDDEHSEMIDSVRLGLRAWFERASVAERDGFLVCPADHPGITAADFDACLRAFRRDAGRIVVASRAGRRGHPIIFPASLAPFVQSPACDRGLNALPRAFPESVVLVACRSPAVTRDIDTEADCDRVRESGGGAAGPRRRHNPPAGRRKAERPPAT